jgi:hypothetical protein
MGKLDGKGTGPDGMVPDTDGDGMGSIGTGGMAISQASRPER